LDESRSELLFVVHDSDQRGDLFLGEFSHCGVEEILFFRELGERGRKVGILQAEESLRPRSVSNGKMLLRAERVIARTVGVSMTVSPRPHETRKLGLDAFFPPKTQVRALNGVPASRETKMDSVFLGSCFPTLSAGKSGKDGARRVFGC